MKINFNNLLYAISYALDCVEHELIGVSTYHSKRVAYISVCMGKEMGLSAQELSDLSAYAILHDNALTQYIKAEYEPKKLTSMDNNQLQIHCILGEENVKHFPFYKSVPNALLYHHENFDGSGAFGKKYEEIPLYARIIHFADTLDARCNLKEKKNDKYDKVIKFLDKNANTLFDESYIELFKTLFPEDKFKKLQNENIDVLLEEVVPENTVDYSIDDVIEVVKVIAKIVDYKSSFTQRHSTGIAEKAYIMGKYYDYDEDTCKKLYIAGSLHDIGKLVISNDVLEKPASLTDDEFKYMKTHVYYTYQILSRIKGFEDITEWASMHHEKLDGSGYPFNKVGNKLSKNDRLLACLDIYQALIEPRPYKEGMSHESAMKILYTMAGKKQIDLRIVNDIDMRLKNKKTD